MFEELKSLLATPLWHYDDTEVAAICQIFLSGGHVSKIVINSDEGRPLYEFGDIEKNGSKAEFFYAKLYYESKPIGSIEFYPQKPGYFEQNKYYFFTTIFAILNITICITIATWLLLRMYVKKPIRELLTWIDKVEHGDYDIGKVEYPQVEIQSVVKHFSSMVSSIEHRERQIRESQNRYRALFESANDAILIIKKNGTIMDCNKKTMEMFDCSREEIVGQQSYKLSPKSQPDGENSKEKAEDKMRAVLGGKSQYFEWENTKLDGTPFTVQIGLNTVELNAKTYIQAIIREITEEKRAEKERMILAAQLQQAQKVESIGRLAGGIAHDFNNILSSILGFGELVQADLSERDSEIRENINEVITAGLRAKDLVQHILTFSRHSEIDKSWVRMNLLVREAVKFLRASLPASIEILTDLKDGNGTVFGDAGQIHQIVMNLCTNAVYAMKPKGGVLEIRLEKRFVDRHDTFGKENIPPGEYLRLMVSDTGPGIPAELIDRIFDPFFTTKKRGEGTGMGLSVVHGIVREMKGGIDVQSEPGNGAVFKVMLPFQAEGVDIEAPDPQRKIMLGEGRILFVDDEKSIVLAVGKMLERFGYDVVTMTESLDALELFESQPDAFDMVITDLGMPKMNGIDLSRKMQEKRSGLPIILCTGFSEGIRQENLRGLGIQAMIMKPVIAIELAETIKRVLTMKR